MNKLDFIHYKRIEATERDPKQRIDDWGEHIESLDEAYVQQQSKRCMDCGTPFCHIGMEIGQFVSGCPLHNVIPEWNMLVSQGKWKEAYARLVKTNNFPEFTGRVCPAPCEGACTAELASAPVTIKNIELAISEQGFTNGWARPNVPTTRSGKKIAIVGSGPAGLASGDELNQRGHEVTIFEKADEPGGLLLYGIPNMKLDKQVVARRIALLKEAGITFVTNIEVGKDVTLQTLQTEYDAVILCVGAQTHRALQLKGDHARGIHEAMDYLTEATEVLQGKRTDQQAALHVKDKNVIVIGGGDTGADCVATALRQACKSIVQFGKYEPLPEKRHQENSWPELPQIFTMDYAYKEASAVTGEDPRRYNLKTKEILLDETGHVKGVHTVETKATKGKDGTWVWEDIPGSETVWEADCILVAIGFEPPAASLYDRFHVSQGAHYESSEPGVFLAGDARRGQSLVVWAIQEGREVARHVHAFVEQQSVVGE
ncbi:glutamate synthase subunit beta [Fictibacillus macauensis ZFHKF-1]|uniref:Glutamate synthase subunit beta n=1 Tax=Fictibacillus macauensis ZFHKF-1 TaxID=1196324 RepID=I8J4N9_9BACL|nr:glutamate synthase subunit beta [Fictibacillus macauensis]EIT86746.1 glutamate synthase subunit beta [Fictibacillus macauensis ZFHKF-1]